MGKDWRYIAYLLVAVLVYLGLKLFSPRHIDWTVTYHHQDKKPFGTYALYQFIGSMFPDHRVHQSNYTLYELFDTLNVPVNFLSLSGTFNPDKEDTEVFLRNIARGGAAFIAAQYFVGAFADTLSLHTSDYFFDQFNIGFKNRDDTLSLRFRNPLLKPQYDYRYPVKNIHNYFSEYDSALTRTVADNSLQLPVLLKVHWGEGVLYLSSTPLAFTNVYFLSENNYEFAELALSHLPDRETYWTEFYHLGRMEPRTPLRFILSNESLRWAYYLTLFGLVVFMVFEAKRKQRIIPIVKPFTNTSLEFVRTIGNLYYQSHDHKSIAHKRIQFLLEQIRSKYGIHAHSLEDDTVQVLARKTGNTEETVQELFKITRQVQSKDPITEEELRTLSRKIDSFKH